MSDASYREASRQMLDEYLMFLFYLGIDNAYTFWDEYLQVYYARVDIQKPLEEMWFLKDTSDS